MVVVLAVVDASGADHGKDRRIFVKPAVGLLFRKLASEELGMGKP